MEPSSRREDDLTRADELRRRLYRPDATEADRREYAALLAEAQPTAVRTAEPDRLAHESDPAPVPRRRRRRLVALGIGGLALALVAGAAVAQQTAAPTLLLPKVPTAAATIGPVPDQPVMRLASSSDEGAQEFRGRGSGTAALGSIPTTQGGRLDVMITLSDPAPVHWSARRVEIHLDGDQYVRVLDEHRTTQAGAVPSTYRYDGVPPTSIRVEVPAGIAWSLVVLPHD